MTALRFLALAPVWAMAANNETEAEETTTAAATTTTTVAPTTTTLAPTTTTAAATTVPIVGDDRYDWVKSNTKNMCMGTPKMGDTAKEFFLRVHRLGQTAYGACTSASGAAKFITQKASGVAYVTANTAADGENFIDYMDPEPGTKVDESKMDGLVKVLNQVVDVKMTHSLPYTETELMAAAQDQKAMMNLINSGFMDSTADDLMGGAMDGQMPGGMPQQGGDMPKQGGDMPQMPAGGDMPQMPAGGNMPQMPAGMRRKLSQEIKLPTLFMDYQVGVKPTDDPAIQYTLNVVGGAFGKADAFTYAGAASYLGTHGVWKYRTNKLTYVTPSDPALGWKEKNATTHPGLGHQTKFGVPSDVQYSVCANDRPPIKNKKGLSESCDAANQEKFYKKDKTYKAANGGGCSAADEAILNVGQCTADEKVGEVTWGKEKSLAEGSTKFSIFGITGGDNYETKVIRGQDGYPKGMTHFGTRVEIGAEGYDPATLKVAYSENNEVSEYQTYDRKNRRKQVASIRFEAGSGDNVEYTQIDFPAYFNAGVWNKDAGAAETMEVFTDSGSVLIYLNVLKNERCEDHDDEMPAGGDKPQMPAGGDMPQMPAGGDMPQMPAGGIPQMPARRLDTTCKKDPTLKPQIWMYYLFSLDKVGYGKGNRYFLYDPDMKSVQTDKATMDATKPGGGASGMSAAEKAQLAAPGAADPLADALPEAVVTETKASNAADKKEASFGGASTMTYGNLNAAAVKRARNLNDAALAAFCKEMEAEKARKAFCDGFTTALNGGIKGLTLLADDCVSKVGSCTGADRRSRQLQGGSTVKIVEDWTITKDTASAGLSADDLVTKLNEASDYANSDAAKTAIAQGVATKLKAVGGNLALIDENAVTAETKANKAAVKSTTPAGSAANGYSAAATAVAGALGALLF